MKTFEEMNLEPMILKAVKRMGFEEATPIQEQTIPLALEGRDMIGRAQTGTGKTAAYGIPLIDKSTARSRRIQGLVITPTRELAIQVSEELNRIGQDKHIWALPVYGGQEMERQIRALRKGPQIIVATPGRLMDHMRRRSIGFPDLKVLVLDEADEMLNMGFKEDIEAILQEIPRERQTLLFSATMPPHIMNLAREFMNEPQTVHINPKEMTVAMIEQQYVELSESQKLNVLCRLLDIQEPALGIVFARTKRRVDEIAGALSSRNYMAEGLHGDHSQNTRDAIMQKFKAGQIEILVATDVAARGLDINGVSHVYNFDIPQDSESYVHRIGRTGRAGGAGLATSFVTSREIGHLKYIEHMIKHQIKRIPIPTMGEALAGLQRGVVDNLQRTVEFEDTRHYKSLAEGLLSEYDSVTLLSAALKMLTKEPQNAPFQELTEAPPIKLRSLEKPVGGSRSKSWNHSSRPLKRVEGGRGRRH